MDRPFSQACENNKEPILAVLRQYFSESDLVLEIGSGTGQHAVHFAKHLPHLCWQCSDQAEYLPGILAWLEWAHLSNTPKPLELNVNQLWPIESAPALFSANTVHIMSWTEVEKLFDTVANVLSLQGVFCLYGPFNYEGAFTSASNEQFDQWLKSRDPLSGIRDFEAINSLATRAGLILLADHPMPANNHCLVWRKQQ